MSIGRTALAFTLAVALLALLAVPAHAGARLPSAAATTFASTAGAATDTAPLAEPSGSYRPLTKTVLYDSLHGIGTRPGWVAPGTTRAVPVTGHGPVPATGVAAVQVELLADGATTTGYLTAWAYGTARPNTVSEVFAPGATSTVLPVPLGRFGYLAVYAGSGARLHVRVVVLGYYVGGAPGRPVGATHVPAPSRLVDTDRHLGIAGAIDPYTEGTVALGHARFGCWSTSLLLVVTVIHPDASGFVYVHDASSGPPEHSVSFVRGVSVSAAVAVRSGNSLIIGNDSDAQLHVDVDVLDYTCRAQDSAGSTDPGIGGQELATRGLAAGQSLVFRVAGVRDRPRRLRAVLLTATVRAGRAAGSLTAFASGTAPVGPGDLTFPAARDTSGLLTMPVGADGAVGVRNDSADTVLITFFSGAFVLDYGRITGTARDFARRTVPGARVVAGQYDGGPFVAAASALADGSGHFELPLPYGAYWVCVDGSSVVTTAAPTGYVDTCFGTEPPSLPDVAMAYTATDTVHDVVTPATAGQLTGRVVDPGGHPLAGVVVKRDRTPDAMTGADGRYTLRGVPDGFAPTCWDGWEAVGATAHSYSESCDATNAVTVTAGHSLAHPETTLSPAGAVSGTVTDGAGTPLAGKLVFVRGSMAGYDPRTHGQAITDAAGRYMLRGVAAGSNPVVEFGAHQYVGEPFSAQIYHGQPIDGTPDPIDVVADRTTTGIDAALQPDSTVSGRITDDQGNPVGGTQVGVSNRPGVSGTYNSGLVYTAADGTYSVPAVSAAHWYVCAQGNDHSADTCYHVGTDTATKVDVAPATTVSGIDIVLTPR